jgi:ankyrin repeat protein
MFLRRYGFFAPGILRRVFFAALPALALLVPVYGQTFSKEYNLLLAISRKDAQAVSACIDQGADINAILSPAEVSAFAKQYVIDKKWDAAEVTQGAIRDIERTFTLTPLHNASRMGYTEIAARLLAAGANPNAVATQGSTILYDTVSNGYVDTARLLIRSGADVNYAWGDGRTILMYCSEYPDTVELIPEIIAAGANLNVRDNGYFGRTALGAAAANGIIAAVRLLAGAGADINAQAKDGKTPLMEAISDGANLDARRAAVAFFIEAGANLDLTDTQGRSALYFALDSHEIEIAHKLLDAGAGIQNDFVDKNGKGILAYAIERGSYDLTAKMLARGADPNPKDGGLPLGYAISHGNKAIARLLVEAGADINAKNRRGETMFLCALWEMDDDFTLWLIERGADVNCAAGNGSGYSALMYAVHFGNLALVKKMLEAGADVRYREANTLKTALIIAARESDDPALVKLLIDSGAIVSALDSYGKDALYYAEQYTGNQKIITLLREAATP